MTNHQTKFKILLTAATLLISLVAQALEFPLPPPGSDIVGALKTIKTVKGDTLSSLGIQYNIGYYEMVEVNPEASEVGKLKPGTDIVIPSRFLLHTTRQGLVINLAELRAYWFPADDQVVYTFPVGAGREGWNTPVGMTKVINKKQDPVWIVPDSILAESKRLGKKIKRVYPAGPDNPLGKYAIYFSLPGIRMHGTNMPASVGRRASHGCIRMLPNDIKFLYEHVPIGTPVQITHEQNKVGWDGPILYLESEVPFNEYRSESAQDEILQATKNHPAIIDQQLVKETIENKDGIPTAIGHDNTVSSLPMTVPQEPAIGTDDNL